MTYHRLMIAAALLLAALGLRVYVPAESEHMLAAVQQLIGENEYVLPGEAVAWMDWR